jgi:hypothetical protein
VAAEASEHPAIAWLPAWPAQLPLEHAKLMSECEYLGSKLGVGPSVDEAEVCEEG